METKISYQDNQNYTNEGDPIKMLKKHKRNVTILILIIVLLTVFILSYMNGSNIVNR